MNVLLQVIDDGALQLGRRHRNDVKPPKKNGNPSHVTDKLQIGKRSKTPPHMMRIVHGGFDASPGTAGQHVGDHRRKAAVSSITPAAAASDGDRSGRWRLGALRIGQ